MRVVAISGHARHGKDTVASILSDRLKNDGQRVITTHYGDLVKYVCKMFFGWDGNKDERGRTLLQMVGTDVVRNLCQNYWVGFILDMIRFFGDNWDYVLIPDARFPNEIGYLADAGIDVIHLRVNRGNFDNGLTYEQKNHPSETSLDRYGYDWLIENDGGLDELHSKVEMFIKEKLYGKE